MAIGQTGIEYIFGSGILSLLLGIMWTLGHIDRHLKDHIETADERYDRHLKNHVTLTSVTEALSRAHQEQHQKENIARKLEH